MRGRRAFRASLGLVLPATLALATFAAACSKKNDDDAHDAGGPDASPASAVAVDAGDRDAAVDKHAEELRLALEDAGRQCGDGKGLPDCPLQAWMKRYANTMIGFGDITAIADVFDRIAKQAPQDIAPNGLPIYTNWASIARDGASAARAGDIPAAKAACRGCHVQYLNVYHFTLRGRPLPAP